MPEKLTARRLETLKPPASGRIELSDSQTRGLAYRVTAKGERTWTLRGRIDGREVRYHLGDYPALGLSDARIAASELRARLRRGEDPRADEEAERTRREAAAARIAARTVGSVLKQYWDLHLCEKANAPTWRRALEKALAPRLNTPIDELSTLDLDAAVAAIRRAGTPVQANRVRSHLRTFTKWMHDKGLCGRDAGKGMARKTEEHGRDRILELSELAAIWRASLGPGGQSGSTDQRAPGQGPVWGPFIRFLMLTGQRFGDVAFMEWGHLSGATWSQPAARTKNKKAHVVHLTSVARLLLNTQLNNGVPGSGLVFKTRSGLRLMSSHRRMSKLREESGVTDFTLHDFRTAMASHLAGRGHSEGVVDRILNHSASASRVSAVARAYQRNDLLEQRAQALEDWSKIVIRAVDMNP